MRTQSLANLCAAIFTVYFVLHCPPPCAMAINKTCTDQLWDRREDSPAPKSKGQCVGNTPNTLIVEQILISQKAYITYFLHPRLRY